MGKRLKQQRRGKGSPTYAAPHKRFKVDLSYRQYDDIEKAGVLKAEVVKFVDNPLHHAPLILVKYENKEENHLIAPEGIAIGDIIDVGAQGRFVLGSVLPLYRFPDGAYAFNIERNAGDGGKMVKAPGSYAIVVAKKGSDIYLKLPSKKTIVVSNECRAQVGVAAGGGRLKKPLLKAGNAYYKYHALNRYWPKVRGVHMAAYCHPHGGKQHHVGKPTTVPRSAPPGAKVGHIAAKATGRKKARKTAVQEKTV